MLTVVGLTCKCNDEQKLGPDGRCVSSGVGRITVRKRKTQTNTKSAKAPVCDWVLVPPQSHRWKGAEALPRAGEDQPPATEAGEWARPQAARRETSSPTHGGLSFRWSESCDLSFIAVKGPNSKLPVLAI